MRATVRRTIIRHMKPLTCKKAITFISLLLVMSSIVGAASPAGAHYVYEGRRVYSSPTLCLDGRAEISHGNGGGYVRVDARVSEPSSYGGVCNGTVWGNRYNVIVKAQLWKYNGRYWELCRDTGWKYSRSVRVSYGSRPPCGRGTYGVTGYAYVENAGWKGGKIESGMHWLG